MAINRSPRYPFFGLGDAITKIEGIYSKEGRAPFTKELAAEHCGYSGYNGSAAKALSALKKYGLLEKSNSGFQLSDDAVKIIALKDNDNNGERAQAIKDAAMRVELFANLLSEYGQTASEKNLTAQLEIKGFSHDGAAKAARSYLSTMDFVAREAGDHDVVPDVDEAEGQEVSKDIETHGNPADDIPPPRIPPRIGMKEDVYNFLNDSQLVVQYPDKLSPTNLEELEDFIGLFLRKMKRMVDTQNNAHSKPSTLDTAVAQAFARSNNDTEGK